MDELLQHVEMAKGAIRYIAKFERRGCNPGDDSLQRLERMLVGVRNASMKLEV